MPTLIPLDMLNCGEWADVAEVSGDLNWVGRMAELGVRVGSRLLVLQPGRTCIVQVGPSRLSLRGDSSLQVMVRPVLAAG